ncbi:helix-turn-helix domain-containing protein [Clostridium tyrobutyricum]|uniref:helix-turn-helix domain-containing protein n=1 Tax=Clostridium tyrobutyricum TaxID=1519 RepID=UPI0002F14EA3|nr:helix-turn-helix transcriptional regulator [Clostridium tyrobutyricum]MEA5009686.1 helix-turn-helix transcriptional regulator [Clostridium tyrobutyricum]
MSMIGTKLKEIRKANRLSLKELSNRIDGKISISFLSDIENGRSNPSFENLKLIAAALETPVSFFIEDSKDNIFSNANNDADFMHVINLLQDFKDWNIEDKKELLYYLKAKKVIRDTTNI